MTSPAPSQITTVVLIGHCGMDSSSLTHAVRDALGDVTVIGIDSQAELTNYATGEHLWLINRKLGWGFDSSKGVMLIKQFADQADGPVLMLVSNLADAQAQAVEAGGVEGFGKAQVRESATLDRLREAAELRGAHSSA